MRGLHLRFGRDARPFWFATVSCIVALVNDGFSGKPSPLLHQALLLPLTGSFLAASYMLLRPGIQVASRYEGGPLRIKCWLFFCFALECLSLLGMVYEAQHFVRFGYRHAPRVAAALALPVLGAAIFAFLHKRPRSLLAVIVTAYAAGVAFAMASFPLNYLRSDMLPVISWADSRLIHQLNPYGRMYVGTRVYDFPYLPGMLVSYLPAVAFHVDVRMVTMTCCLAVAGLLYGSVRPEQQTQAVVLIGVFLLSPFLQYRHDLYLQPHWLALTGSIVLLRYGKELWSALLFGVSMAIYQLSWVLFPFLVLYAYRQGSWRGALKAAGLGLAGMLLIVGPFLKSAAARIAGNTVGQWGHMPHALADPINLSYWVTFLVRPDQLKWIQLLVMSGIFGYCLARRRCETLVDMLRWMSVALTLFIMLNVLVDGYFYLTLLLLLLLYTFAASGLWPASGRVGWLDRRDGLKRLGLAGSTAAEYGVCPLRCASGRDDTV